MRIFSLLLLAAAGCGVVEPGVGELVQAVGEPQNGFPSPEERLGIMAINRGRSDPATIKGAKSAMYPARPPVIWSYELSRSSRFHATNLQLSKATLMHTSPCPLNANIASANCNGAPACACASAVPQQCANCANAAAINNCGTDTFTRIRYFSNIATGEVAAAGYNDVIAVVDGWMDEAAGADGHRRNLTDQGITSNMMGFGHAGGGGCWSSFDVSDSGNQGGLAIPEIPTAAVSPAHPGGGTARFYATWADPVSGAPQSLWVVVDGKCSPMQQEIGSPTLNSTWYADVNVAAGCHTYWVLGRDGRSARSTYPTTGAIYLPVGGAACPSDYIAQAPAAACEGNVPPADMARAGGAGDLAAGAGGRDQGGGGSGGNVGDACQVHTDCHSGVCATVAAGSGYCTATCDPADPSACPAGMTCGLIDNANYCVRAAVGGGHDVSGCSVVGRAAGGRQWALWLLPLAVLARRRSATFGRPAKKRSGTAI